MNDREIIFKSLLPEETFVDRRIHVVQDIPMESESEPENIDFIEQKLDPRVGSKTHLLIFEVVGGSREQFSTHGSQMRAKGGSVHSSRVSSSRLRSN